MDPSQEKSWGDSQDRKEEKHTVFLQNVFILIFLNSGLFYFFSEIKKYSNGTNLGEEKNLFG